MTKPITHRPLVRAGRKPTTPPANAAARIQALAAEGRSIVGIAHRLGVGKDALNAWLEREPALQEALELGREDKRHSLYMLLLRAAKKGNVTAALAILNSEHGWRDGQSDQTGGVTVNIALPDALPLKQYMAITARGRAPAIEAKEAANG